jgi:hypothetical protein
MGCERDINEDPAKPYSLPRCHGHSLALAPTMAQIPPRSRSEELAKDKLGRTSSAKEDALALNSLRTTRWSNVIIQFDGANMRRRCGTQKNGDGSACEKSQRKGRQADWLEAQVVTISKREISAAI